MKEHGGCEFWRQFGPLVPLPRDMATTALTEFSSHSLQYPCRAFNELRSNLDIARATPPGYHVTWS